MRPASEAGKGFLRVAVQTTAEIEDFSVVAGRSRNIQPKPCQNHYDRNINQSPVMTIDVWAKTNGTTGKTNSDQLSKWEWRNGKAAEKLGGGGGALTTSSQGNQK